MAIMMSRRERFVSCYRFQRQWGKGWRRSHAYAIWRAIVVGWDLRRYGYGDRCD